MTPIEIIAAIFAIVILLKVVMINLVRPKFVLKFAKPMFKNKVLMPLVSLVMIAVIGYFLVQELAAAQIMAAMLFGIFVYALGMVMYPKVLTKFMEEIMKNKSGLWLSMLVWVIISVWVLYSVF